jgi:hypothetical protein
LCGAQPTRHFDGGNFQVIAAEPVLLGGQSEVPAMGFEQASGTFGAQSTGTIMIIAFVWQQSCPPRKGSDRARWPYSLSSGLSSRRCPAACSRACLTRPGCRALRRTGAFLAWPVTVLLPLFVNMLSSDNNIRYLIGYY